MHQGIRPRPASVLGLLLMVAFASTPLLAAGPAAGVEPAPLETGVFRSAGASCRAKCATEPRLPDPPVQPDVPDPAPVRLHELREAVPVPARGHPGGAAARHGRPRRPPPAGGGRGHARPAGHGRGALAPAGRPHPRPRRSHRRRCGAAGHGPATRVVAAQSSAIAQFFGLTWPTGTAAYDLGDRLIDIVPIPGHEAAHIAIYDRRTGILLTGDTMYPGRLYVSTQQAFRDSVDRLVDFTQSRPIAHVLGAHIENTRWPFLDYPVGTQYQPEEHVPGAGARAPAGAAGRAAPDAGAVGTPRPARLHRVAVLAGRLASHRCCASASFPEGSPCAASTPTRRLRPRGRTRASGP